MARGGQPPPDPVGMRLVEPDRRQPGGAAARHQRGHAGLPVVREGARRRHGLEPSEGHHRDPAAHQRRQRPAGRRRREPGQHVLGRRPPHPPDAQQRHRARAREGGARLLRLLREPLLAHADDRADRQRHDPREVGVAERAPPGRPPAGRARRPLPAGPRLDDRDPARPRRDVAAVGRLRGPAGGLLDIRRLRRDRPPLGHRAAGDAARPGAARPAVPPARAGHPRRAAALPPRRPLRPRPDRRHPLPPALRTEPRGPGGPADRRGQRGGLLPGGRGVGHARRVRHRGVRLRRPRGQGAAQGDRRQAGRRCRRRRPGGQAAADAPSGPARGPADPRGLDHGLGLPRADLPHQGAGPASREAIDRRHPRLIAGLRWSTRTSASSSCAPRRTGPW